MMAVSPTQIKAHHARVRALGCLVHGCLAATIHHCHSGSLADAGWTRGWAQRGVSEALVIPICSPIHSVGQFAIDGGFGVRSWETKFGTQMDFLREVSELLGYDLFELALKWGYTKDGRHKL